MNILTAAMRGSFSTWDRCSACSPAWAGRRSSLGFADCAGQGTVPFSSDENRDSPHRAVLATLWLLAAIAVGISVRDFLKPHKDPSFQRDRDFARWFWTEKSRDGELVCVKHDFGGRCFCQPAEGDDLASIFYCNQRIYWPRLARGEKPQWDRILEDPAVAVRPFPADHHDAAGRGGFSSLAEGDDVCPQAGVGRAGSRIRSRFGTATSWSASTRCRFTSSRETPCRRCGKCLAGRLAVVRH